MNAHDETGGALPGTAPPRNAKKKTAKTCLQKQHEHETRSDDRVARREDAERHHLVARLLDARERRDGRGQRRDGHREVDDDGKDVRGCVGYWVK